MTYEELVNSCLQLIDEYSKKGTVNPAAKTVDYRLKIPGATNAIQMDLASTTGKLPKEWEIINNPVYNEVSRDTSSIKNHIPGTDDTAVTLTGALSYYIEASGYYDIYIEEEISGVWTTLVRLQPTSGSEPITFTELKGLLAPSSSANSVRIRCTGNYPYPYRNYILYPYNFPTAALVQQNKAWFEQTLPADWLKFNNAMIRRDTRQYVPFSDYKITPTHFAWNRYAVGEILVNYYRKPTAIVVVDPSILTPAEKAQPLDAAPDACQIIPLGVVGTILAGDNAAMSSYFLNLYESRKYSLLGQDGNYGITTVESVTGW